MYRHINYSYFMSQQEDMYFGMSKCPYNDYTEGKRVENPLDMEAD